jgi:hypothetical protein
MCGAEALNSGPSTSARRPEMRAAHLQDLSNSLPLASKASRSAASDSRSSLQPLISAMTESGRVRVVGRLRAVDVVVRAHVLVLALAVTERLESDVGDHLVRVHVGGGACPALDHFDRETGR